MALNVPSVCSKCGKGVKDKPGKVISFHFGPPAVCFDCEPPPPPVDMVEVPRAEWEALVRFLRLEEKVYKDSYNTPGKKDWEQFFRENHPSDWKIFDAARQAASRKF